MVVSEPNTLAEAPGTVPARFWKDIVEPVAPFLNQVSADLAAQVAEFHPDIAEYTRYALSNQGKQIRPALVALSGSAIGHLNEPLLRVAVIVEMIHLATLVHDDIMDEAELRRCRPALAANWGNEIAVLVGDCLFAHALTLAANFPTPDICRAVSKATNTVCSGEILQTNQRHNFGLSRADYIKTLEMKTGELFALSCELGSCLAGGSAVENRALRAYGMALGTAYQIYDDCLDLYGSESITGKTLGTDLSTGKPTLPILMTWEKATGPDREMLRNSVETLDASDLERIFELLHKYNALSDTRRAVLQYIRQSQAVLRELKPSKGVEALMALGEYLAQQTRSLGVNDRDRLA